MAWNEHTTFHYEGYRTLAAFRVFRNLGCVLMWKPTMFGIAFEKFKEGGAIHLGPVSAGFGPIDK